MVVALAASHDAAVRGEAPVTTYAAHHNHNLPAGCGTVEEQNLLGGGLCAAASGSIDNVEAASDAHQRLLDPAWYTPHRLMAIFCFIMCVVWLDVGVFASNGVNGSPRTDTTPGSGIQGEFNLSYFEDGVLPAMFMVGLMLASVCLAELATFFPAFRLIGLGMGVWSLAVLATGLAGGFWSMLFARMFVGAGEASIITLSAPFIDDAAPPASKSVWFAILTVFPSLGVAAGYMLGPAIAGPLGWRACFYIEAAIGVPIVLFTLLMPVVHLRGQRCLVAVHGAQAGKRGWRSAVGSGVRGIWRDVKVLHRHPVFLYNNWGYVPIQACLGAFTYWGPKAAHELYGVSKDTADTVLGVIVVCTAMLGTLAGGVSLDRLGSSMQNAVCINLVAVSTGLVFLIVSFAAATTFTTFCAVFSLGLLGLFVATAPLYAVGMWSIPVDARPAGQAFLVVTMHLLGDVTSPPATGAIRSATGSWRWSLGAVSCTLVISIVIYSFGIRACPSAPDYRLEEPEAACCTGRLQLAHDFV